MRQTVVSEIPVTVEVTVVPETLPESTTVSTEVTMPRTESVQLASSVGERSYSIFVVLPEGYSSSKTTHPVVYVLDGHVSFVWATEYSPWLSSGEALPPTIIVGIDNSRLRNRDLVPDNEEGVRQFLTFMQEDLIPFVDDHYGTKPADRTLAGASYGGLFALYALFRSPETFQRYIVTTPALSSDYDGLEMQLAILEHEVHMTTVIQGFMDGLRAVFGRR